MGALFLRVVIKPFLIGGVFFATPLFLVGIIEVLVAVLLFVDVVLFIVGFLVVETFGGVRTFLRVVALGVGFAVAAKAIGAPRSCSAIRAIATLRNFTA